MSSQNDRMTVRLSGPEFIVMTRKIAARVSGVTRACAMVFAQLATSGSQLGSYSIDVMLSGLAESHSLGYLGRRECERLGPAYYRFPPRLHGVFRAGGR